MTIGGRVRQFWAGEPALPPPSWRSLETLVDGVTITIEQRKTSALGRWLKAIFLTEDSPMWRDVVVLREGVSVVATYGPRRDQPVEDFFAVVVGKATELGAHTLVAGYHSSDLWD